MCAQRVSTAFDSNLRVLWLGMHRSAIYPSYNNTLDCINSDGTPCDYFNITGASGTEDATASKEIKWSFLKILIAFKILNRRPALSCIAAQLEHGMTWHAITNKVE